MKKIYFTICFIFIVLFVSSIAIQNFKKVIYAQANSLQIENKGWDPGLTKRRIATFKIDSTYFESCPDEPNGCYGTIPSGGGFYTLSPDLGDIGIPCKVNSGELFSATPGADRQTCPYYFDWGISNQGKLSAIITTNTTNWTNSFTLHNYLGFQENMPYGQMYLGGKNLPYINNNHYQITIFAKATGLDSGSVVRFLIGTSWYVPTLNKSVVLELNLDNINVDTSKLPEWNTTQEATQSLFCPTNTICLYLGGKYWGYNSLINKGQQDITIDWSRITRQLVQDNYLPAQVIGSYPAGIYSGQEIFGKANVSMEISNATLYSLNLPGDLNHDGKVDIFDYNLMIQNFGNTTCGNIADIDGNCKVDIFDYNTLIQNFGKTN